MARYPISLPNAKRRHNATSLTFKSHLSTRFLSDGFLRTAPCFKKNQHQIQVSLHVSCRQREIHRAADTLRKYYTGGGEGGGYVRNSLSMHTTRRQLLSRTWHDLRNARLTLPSTCSLSEHTNTEAHRTLSLFRMVIKLSLNLRDEHRNRG